VTHATPGTMRFARPVSTLPGPISTNVGAPPAEQSEPDLTTAEDVNRRLQELALLAISTETGSLQDYRIGAGDLLARLGIERLWFE